MDDSFLARLQCPICKTKLALVDADKLTTLNELIETRKLVDQSGELIEEMLDAALVNEEGSFAYPMQDTIPTLIAERAIPLFQLDTDQLDTDSKLEK
ncbi:MAG: hypothetical protein ACI9HK_003131 [Pirellulaceae bacterium]|jgi:uncharacterized protein YbaR (Trm112 family)